MSKTEISKEEIYYNPNRPYLQGLLRVALFKVWEGRCHWGNEPLGSVLQVEMDHIIPVKNYQDILESMRHDLSRYSDDEAHVLSQLTDNPHLIVNLAPICRAHNGMKSDAAESSYLGPTINALMKAAKRADKVKNAVLRMMRATGLQEAAYRLLTINEAKHDQATKELVEKYGTDIVSSLWAFSPETVSNFKEPRAFHLNMKSSNDPDWVATAQARGIELGPVIELSNHERSVLDGADYLNNINWKSSLERGIEDAVEENVRRCKEDLRLEGAQEVDVVGRIFVTASEHELHRDEHTNHTFLELKFKISMKLEKTVYDMEETDYDGNPSPGVFEEPRTNTAKVRVNLSSGGYTFELL